MPHKGQICINMLKLYKFRYNFAINQAKNIRIYTFTEQFLQIINYFQYFCDRLFKFN